MLPNVVVIGAMKSGTTSLRHYLDAHPRVSLAPGGLNFFIEERNWSKGRAWYESHFDADADILCDASPRYANFPIHRGVAERMANLIPDARLIYLVRDPIERLVSHYRHRVAKGEEHRPFAEAFPDLETSPYVVRGLYATQIEEFARYYPLSRIHVLLHEDLRDRRRQTMRAVFEFLGVDGSIESPVFADTWHRTADKRRPADQGGGPVDHPEVPEVLRRTLTNVFRPEIERLSAILGRSLDWCR